MVYDIYFHNDFDGAASAALLTDFLGKRGDKIGRYFAVGHGSFNKNRWLALKFKNPAAVVDFLYHPSAAFWFDHHPTTFLRKEWRRKFKPSRFHCWKADYFSAYHLVFDSLIKNFGYRPSRYFRELVVWVDIDDGARYDSAEQTIKLKESALRVSVFIERNAEKTAVLIKLIKILGKQSLRRIADRPEIKNAVRKFREETKAVLKFYERNLRIFGKVGFADLSGSNLVEMPFAPFYLRPELSYRLFLKRDGEKFRLSASFNPWSKKKNKIDIGKFLREKYGGGGHYNVGGVSNLYDIKKARKMADEIIDFLNKNGS